MASIACGAFHNMALSREGKVFTWGTNDYGQLGNGEERGGAYIKWKGGVGMERGGSWLVSVTRPHSKTHIDTPQPVPSLSRSLCTAAMRCPP